MSVQQDTHGAEQSLEMLSPAVPARRRRGTWDLVCLCPVSASGILLAVQAQTCLFQGHYYGTILDNVFEKASFGGMPSSTCLPPLPSPGALYIDLATTSGSVLQPGYATSPITFLICSAPTPILTILAYTSPASSS